MGTCRLSRVALGALALVIGLTLLGAPRAGAQFQPPPNAVFGASGAAVVLAADQPAAAQPQMVRFVSHIVSFMPKDPSILGDGRDPLKQMPTWFRYAVRLKTKGGCALTKPLAEAAPDLGPLDALEGRDPKAVAELLARLDSRWEYHVLTLSGSGAVGQMLVDAGRVAPMDKWRTDVFRVVRVDKILGDGDAVWQAMLCTAGGNSSGCTGNTPVGEPSEVKLGAPTMAYAQSVGVLPHTSPTGAAHLEAVTPGLLCLETVELGAWDPPQPAAYY